MDTFYDRTALLIGEDALNKIKDARVLIIGLGGVGGYIVEALARASVGHLDLCDYDLVDTTNINRQIFALTDTVGALKVDVAKDRIRKINPHAQVMVYPFRLDADTLPSINIHQYDYIADAIDDVKAKILLMKAALECGTPIISSMGTGNKRDPFKFKIDVIEKTHTCPLAKAVRKELHTLGIKGIPVLFSEESPQVQPHDEERPTTASISYMPAIAGLMIAGRILMDLSDLK